MQVPRQQELKYLITIMRHLSGSERISNNRILDTLHKVCRKMWIAQISVQKFSTF